MEWGQFNSHHHSQDVPGLLGRGTAAEALGGPGTQQFGAGHAVPGGGAVLPIDRQCHEQRIVRLYYLQGHAQVDQVSVASTL